MLKRGSASISFLSYCHQVKYRYTKIVVWCLDLRSFGTSQPRGAVEYLKTVPGASESTRWICMGTEAHLKVCPLQVAYTAVSLDERHLRKDAPGSFGIHSMAMLTASGKASGVALERFFYKPRYVVLR